MGYKMLNDRIIARLMIGFASNAQAQDKQKKKSKG